MNDVAPRRPPAGAPAATKVLILTPPKTASQSVYRSLKAAGVAVNCAHTLGRAMNEIVEWRGTKLPTPVFARVRPQIAKERDFLLTLLDIRIRKVVVTIRRDLQNLLPSLLFHQHFGKIRDLFDEERSAFASRDAMKAALRDEMKAAAEFMKTYYTTVYEPLGIPRHAVEQPFSIVEIRPDLEVVSLRFEALAEDFKSLVSHLGAHDCSLLHVNEARDRSDRRSQIIEAPTEAERSMYSAFKRDFQVPAKIIAKAVPTLA